jgi:hypothetical protein
VFTVNARLARQDQDFSAGHQGIFLYSASLAANPLPTLSHSLVYSGQAVSGVNGGTYNNSLSFYNRLIPYRGVALLAGYNYSIAQPGNQQLARTNTITLSLQLQPNTKVSFGATYGHGDSVIVGPGQKSRAYTDRFDGTATFNPVPALYLSGGLSRTLSQVGPTTLGNAAASFSPFPGGDLQVGVNYTESFNSVTGTTTMLSPLLRWNIRPGAFLTASYLLLDTSGNGSSTQSRTLDLNLTIAL